MRSWASGVEPTDPAKRPLIPWWRGLLAWKFQGRLDISPNGDPLYDAGARFYAPYLGMFSQLDSVTGKPTDPRSMNRFLYAAANPWTFSDPSGHAYQSTCMHYGDCDADRPGTTKRGPTPTSPHPPAPSPTHPCTSSCGIDQAAESTPDPSAPTPTEETTSVDADYTVAAVTRLGGCSAADLNCTYEQFRQMSASQRLAWLQEFQSLYDTKGWFNAIEGVLQLADYDKIIEKSDWSSTVDAGILIGLQDGKRIQQGGDAIDPDNPGTSKWTTFFRTLDNDVNPPTAQDLKVLWGNAEQATTEYGVHRASDLGLAPNTGDRALYGWTDIWRAGVRAAPGLTRAGGLPWDSYLSTDFFEPRDRAKPRGFGHLTYTLWPLAVTAGDVYNHLMDCATFWDGC